MEGRFEMGTRNGSKFDQEIFRLAVANYSDFKILLGLDVIVIDNRA